MGLGDHNGLAVTGGAGRRTRMKAQCFSGSGARPIVRGATDRANPSAIEPTIRWVGLMGQRTGGAVDVEGLPGGGD